MVRAFALSGMFLVIGSCATAGLWPAWHNDASAMIVPCSIDTAPKLQYLGSPSCSNQSCHGQSSDHLFGGERQIWIERDPHSKALAVLHNEDSARMIQALRKIDPSRPMHAYEDQSCLGCHAVSYTHTSTDDKSSKSTLTEAVSCEACHGPAERWLTEHYLSTWKTRGSEEKQKAFGFLPTKDMSARIDQCASCHIGTTGREVNHDLIAAGHPRLAFEYTRFHYAPHYGKHWSEQENNPEFEIRAWFVGQVSTMRSVIGLLHTRLEEKLASETTHKRLSRSWPELSEMSCYACHQGIGKQRARSFSGQRLEHAAGTPGWNLWYFSLVEMLQRQSSLLFRGTTSPKITSLQELLKRMHTSPSQTEQLLKLSAQADEELAQWQKQLQNQKLDISASPQLLHDIAAHALTTARGQAVETLREYDWDYVTQHYLGCAALVHAHAEQTTPWWNDARALVKQLRLALKFPDDASTIRLNSPRDYDPEKAKMLFLELRRLAAAPRSK